MPDVALESTGEVMDFLVYGAVTFVYQYGNK